MAITYTITSRVGSKTSGTLEWKDKKLSSPAVSGPHGNGAVETGTYHAKRNFLLDKTADAYRDASGNCWFQLLDPTFTTSRKEIGIHADGGVEGTAGCIGLKVPDTKAWYDALKNVENNKYTVVTVVDNSKADQPATFADSQ
jgi:hypothetical protein